MLIKPKALLKPNFPFARNHMAMESYDYETKEAVEEACWGHPEMISHKFTLLSTLLLGTKSQHEFQRRKIIFNPHQSPGRPMPGAGNLFPPHAQCGLVRAVSSHFLLRHGS